MIDARENTVDPIAATEQLIGWEKFAGSDSGGLLADLLEGARRRNLSANSLAAYERTWKAFLAWAAAASLDPEQERLLQKSRDCVGRLGLGKMKNRRSLGAI
jgi:hypothetical protein